MLKDVAVKSKMLTAEKFDSEFKKFDENKEAEYKICCKMYEFSFTISSLLTVEEGL